MGTRLLTFLFTLVIGFAAYVRLAPSDPARWHRLPEVTGPGDTTTEGSFKAIRRITATPEDVLETVRTKALSTPRTRLLEGSVDQGMMTFMTRSALWGFPDYTTVAIRDGQLLIYGRLRFGKGDMGVNKARVQDWLGAVGPLTQSL